jgi:hypothetical protein
MLLFDEWLKRSDEVDGSLGLPRVGAGGRAAKARRRDGEKKAIGSRLLVGIRKVCNAVQADFHKSLLLPLPPFSFPHPLALACSSDCSVLSSLSFSTPSTLNTACPTVTVRLHFPFDCPCFVNSPRLHSLAQAEEEADTVVVEEVEATVEVEEVTVAEEEDTVRFSRLSTPSEKSND